MIPVTPATAFLLYLGLLLGFLLFAWVRYNGQRRRREIIPPEFSLLRCEYCQMGYIAKKEKQVTTCPECHSLNKDNLCSLH